MNSYQHAIPSASAAVSTNSKKEIKWHDSFVVDSCTKYEFKWKGIVKNLLVILMVLAIIYSLRAENRTFHKSCTTEVTVKCPILAVERVQEMISPSDLGPQPEDIDQGVNTNWSSPGAFSTSHAARFKSSHHQNRKYSESKDPHCRHQRGDCHQIDRQGFSKLVQRLWKGLWHRIQHLWSILH